MMRTLTGLLAYLIVMATPFRLQGRWWFALLPSAGDWQYRERRKAPQSPVEAHQGTGEG